MKVLIVGGAGFIGSHLVDYHLSRNDTVVAVDNVSTGSVDNIQAYQSNPAFTFYQTDVLQWPDLDAHVKDSDLIYDLAAMVGMFNVLKHPVDTLRVNLHITERLLTSMASHNRKARILVASSSEVYGSRPSAMRETMPLWIEATDKAHASYPVSKLCNEIQAMAWHKEENLSVIVARIFNTVGPRQSSRYGMVLPRFIKQALQNEPLTVFGDGHQIRSFCDVRDLCHMFYQLMLSDKSIGQIINTGNDAPISVLDLAQKVIALTGSKAGLIYQSIETVYGKEYIDIERREPDLEKIKSIIDYGIQWTLDDTMMDMIKAFSTQHAQVRTL